MGWKFILFIIVLVFLLSQASFTEEEKETIESLQEYLAKLEPIEKPIEIDITNDEILTVIKTGLMIAEHFEIDKKILGSEISLLKNVINIENLVTNINIIIPLYNDVVRNSRYMIMGEEETREYVQLLGEFGGKTLCLVAKDRVETTSILINKLQLLEKEIDIEKNTMELLELCGNIGKQTAPGFIKLTTLSKNLIENLNYTNITN